MSKQEECGESVAQDTSPEEQSKNEGADATEALYDNRGPKKIIRFITVIGYVFSVSFVAIGLSAYYVFLWEPPDPKLIDRDELMENPRKDFFVSKSDPSNSVSSFTVLRNNFPENRRKDDGTNFDFERRVGKFDEDYFSEIPEEVDDDSFRMISRNRSMSMLKKILVELLRTRRNSSSVESKNSDLSDKEFLKNHFKERSENSKNNTSLSKFDKTYENASQESMERFRNETDDFGGNKINVTFNISPVIISGVETNNDGFHEADNDQRNGSFRGNHRRDRNFGQFGNLGKDEKN